MYRGQLTDTIHTYIIQKHNVLFYSIYKYTCSAESWARNGHDYIYTNLTYTLHLSATSISAAVESHAYEFVHTLTFTLLYCIVHSVHSTLRTWWRILNSHNTHSQNASYILSVHTLCVYCIQQNLTITHVTQPKTILCEPTEIQAHLNTSV